MHLLRLISTGHCRAPSEEALRKCPLYAATMCGRLQCTKCLHPVCISIPTLNMSLGSVSCIHHLHPQISVIYFEAQNISHHNLRETQTTPALSLWDIFPQMTGRSVTRRDDLSPLISSSKDALYKVK